MQKPLSRLEKFIYALCSLDSSELPNPLSRLEVLLNCLVTGETPPAFEPLSRNEKYLMAISGSYHDELPNPISRGEKLLYKLATGDDSIDDIGEALSRYEELLAYIVENGCLDGPIDVEYVTYILMSGQNTLYNTKEVPVKSAFLTGQTLVNMVPQDKQGADGVSNINLTEGRLTWTAQQDWLKLYFVVNAKPNTKYIIKYHSINENVGIFCRPETTDPHSGWYENVSASNQIIYTYDVGTFVISLENSIASSDLWVQDFMIIEYQDGMENWDIPYFEGMKSVEMPVLTTTGKNLFDDGQAPEQLSWGDNIRKVKVKENTTYVYSSSPYTGYVTVKFYDDNDNETRNGWGIKSGETFITPPNTSYIKTHTDPNSLVQIEEGSVATEYEPYKSNILTCKEEVELRGIGEVKDELGLVTGEVTQRIGEVVFDGSEDWVLSTYVNSTMFYTSFNNLVHKEEDYLNSISCDKLIVHANESYLLNSTSPNGISAYVDRAGRYPNENWIYIKYADSEGYVEKFKQWLSQNPITVQYELATESVKTVDLSILDQDGKETELSTFDDITHVTVSSEGLIPTGEITVATKNATDVIDASVMSLRMDDILNSQSTLEESANAQSDDIDVTMLGVTDIYEQLL